MRRWLCVLLVLCLTVMPVSGHAMSEEGTVFTCMDDSAECLLLQMAVAGSFDDFDPDDILMGRVLMAVYPKLCAVSEQDIRHCAEEQRVSESDIRQSLYRALRNALWAEMIYERVPNGRMDSAGRILLLFIDPATQADSDYQMEQIRQNMTPDVLQALAESAKTSLAFVEWLIRGAQ